MISFLIKKLIQIKLVKKLEIELITLKLIKISEIKKHLLDNNIDIMI